MMRRLVDAIWNLFNAKGRAEIVRLEAEQRLEELRRERELAEAARAEQLIELVEVIMTRAAESNKQQTDAMIEIAKGVQAHGQALNTWFDTFKAYQADGGTASMLEADEHRAKEIEDREREELRALGYPVDASPEQALDFVANLFQSPRP